MGSPAVTAPDTLHHALSLLPAFYLERDARPDGKPGYLQSLLALVAEQLELVDADLDRLYDDLFIETCDSWVVPYIGDLVGVSPSAPTDGGAVLTRAAVADAIALRRRKGTVTALEQIARDVSGWPSAALEMFRRLVVTQNLNQVVPTRGTTASMSSALLLERLDTAFDSSAHTLEVRRIGSGRGRHAVPNVAVTVWRDRRLDHTWSDAAAVDGRRFRFSALGCDQALVTRPRTEVVLTHQASLLNVPGFLSRRAMAATLGEFYGPGLSVTVRRAGEQLPMSLSDVVVCDLSGPTDDASWSNVSRLKPSQVAIDPQLGRLAFGSVQAGPPQVFFATTAPCDVGASELQTRPSPPVGSVVTRVRRDGAGGLLTTLAAALGAAGGSGTVEVGDSRVYHGDLSVDVPAADELRVVSHQGSAPLVALDHAWTVTLGEGGVLTVVGVMVAGGPLVIRGRPDRIELSDCTFVPGQHLDHDALVTPPVGPSLVLDVDADWQTDVIISNCVTGPLLVPADGTTLTISDSIVDSVDDGLGRTNTAAAGRVVPALRSPAPVGTLALPPGSTALQLTLGTDVPRLVELASVPTDAVSAALALDAALQTTGARALAAGDHVVIVGDGRPLAVSSVEGSLLADALRLSSYEARAKVLVGGDVDLSASAAGGTIGLTNRHGTTSTALIAPGATDLGGLAGLVEAGVRAAGPPFAGVLVGVLDVALVLVPPGTAGFTVSTFGSDLAASALGLVVAQPAIAADMSGDPGATIRMSRSTVFGTVQVLAVDVITDSIVTGPILSERQQIGCIQYSWIADGSRTPRQHQCQPATVSTPSPSFVTRHYGIPGYGRLRRQGATAIIRGASDGYEMGALARLQQTQRDDNLRRGIEEFLRFGLEAGVFDGD
jgi:hypothetical protein